MTEGLSDAELAELGVLLPPGAAASLFLRRAGFPAGQIPVAVSGQSRGEYWDLVNLAILGGALKSGADAIREAVLRKWPYNPVFADPAGPVDRVLLIGAGPLPADGTGTGAVLRTEAEWAAVRAAAPALDVQYLPAASAADIRLILDRDPDILHLACHGRRGGVLLFPAGPGAAPARAVHAADLAGALLAYQRERGAARGRGLLHGIVLNACYSVDAARDLLPCAWTVVAHQDDLPDAQAPLLAGALYERLALTRSLARAARIVAAELPLLDAAGRPLGNGIRVFENAAPVPGLGADARA
jgi:hypothetical protein